MTLQGSSLTELRPVCAFEAPPDCVRNSLLIVARLCASAAVVALSSHLPCPLLLLDGVAGCAACPPPDWSASDARNSRFCCSLI